MLEKFRTEPMNAELYGKTLANGFRLATVAFGSGEITLINRLSYSQFDEELCRIYFPPEEIYQIQYVF